MKQERIIVEGVVTQVLTGNFCRVRLTNGHELLGYLAGKLRKNKIKVLPDDRVEVELSPYDTSKCRVVFRFKNPEALG